MMVLVARFLNGLMDLSLITVIVVTIQNIFWN